MKNHNFRNSKQGIAIVLLMIILIVATGIGIWGLTSSRNSLLKAGSRKFSTELTYQAEQGLQKGVRRIQTIAAGPDPVAVSNANDSTPGKTTTGTYSPKDMTFLVNDLCQESTCGSANPACTGFDAIKNFDAIDNNVVCNFLGVVDKNNQVSIVRKNDLNNSGDLFAIFLVNSIATDDSGRKQAIQGVVVVPYSGTTSEGTPYLASSKAVTD